MDIIAPGPANISQVQFTDPAHGVAMGRGFTRVRPAPGDIPSSPLVWTDDGGDTWSDAHLECACVLAKLNPESLWLVNGRLGWALMATGGDAPGQVLLKTDDSGKNWKQQAAAEIEKKTLFRQIWFDRQGQQGWINTHSGPLLKTSDGAKSWQPVPIFPYQGGPLQAERMPLRPMGRLPDPKQPSYLQTSASNLGLDSPDDLPGAVFPGGSEVNTWVDPQDGGYYVCCDLGGKGRGINWASMGIFARIGKLDRAGNWLWMAGDKATGFARPGQFYKPSEFSGIAEGCLFINDWNGQYRIFDKDSGLYVGSLFNDAFRGAAFDENAIFIEFTDGQVYRHPATGETYALAGDACTKLYRVTGLKEIQRFQTTVALGKETK
jgi:hypothetical protein